MNDDDRIDEWVRSRAGADVAPGFADRVVAACGPRSPRWLPTAAVAAAAVVAALRVAAALAVFVAN